MIKVNKTILTRKIISKKFLDELFNQLKRREKVRK